MKVEGPFHISYKLQGNSFKSVARLIDFSRTISSEIHSFLNQWFDSKSYIEIKTSGSTGKPKVIQLQKKYMINSAIATGKHFNLNENTTALLCMSPNFIAGKMMLVRALVLGWHLDVVEPVSNPLEDIDKKYDFSSMVPLQLYNSLGDLHKVKKLIVGGGVVSKELFDKIQNVKSEIFATYGMTETITHIAVKRLNQFRNATFDSESHYTVLPNISISLDDRNCLVIKAPKISDKEIITNDLVTIISSSEFNWLGRVDNIINSGGVKLIPELIEHKLNKIIYQRFFVIGKRDEVLGEKLILIIEGIKNEVIFKQVQHLKILSKYEIPKEIYFIDKFIETPTKKINRKATLKLL